MESTIDPGSCWRRKVNGATCIVLWSRDDKGSASVIFCGRGGKLHVVHNIRNWHDCMESIESDDGLRAAALKACALLIKGIVDAS